MKRKYTEKVKEPMRAPKILSSLLYATSALEKMKGKGKPYDSLIDALARVGIDTPTPSSKELQTKLSASPAKLKKWIDSLYEDFLTGIEEDPALIDVSKFTCWFSFRGTYDSASFICHLPVVPRVGEMISFSFLDAKIGNGLYYVSDVMYEWINSEYTACIWVREGSYNRHFQYLRDKAQYEGTIDLIGKSDYEIQQELKKVYR